jgi:hypothetical protein
MSRTSTAALCAAAALNLSIAAAHADPCTGTWLQVDMQKGSSAISIDDNAAVASHIAIGTCNATMKRCTYWDKDGDSWVNDTSAPGRWTTVSGTGKYAAAVASGTSKLTRTDNGPEGPVYVGTWAGDCSVR